MPFIARGSRELPLRAPLPWRHAGRVPIRIVNVLRIWMRRIRVRIRLACSTVGAMPRSVSARPRNDAPQKQRRSDPDTRNGHSAARVDTTHCRTAWSTRSAGIRFARVRYSERGQRYRPSRHPRAIAYTSRYRTAPARAHCGARLSCGCRARGRREPVRTKHGAP